MKKMKKVKGSNLIMSKKHSLKKHSFKKRDLNYKAVFKDGVWWNEIYDENNTLISQQRILPANY